MMTDPYENDIGMQIARANSEGDIAFLKEMSDTGKFDPCCTTDSAKWNYLHMANMWKSTALFTLSAFA